MKRVIPFVVILFLFITVVVSAENLNKYNGYDIVKVNINNKELSLDVPAIIMNGRTLLPLRKVAEAVNGIVTWDGASRTASILKPQVNIIFAETKDGSTVSGELSEIIPFWTANDRYLSHISIGGLPTGKYVLYCGIYKSDKNNNIDLTAPIDTKPEYTINAAGPNTPAWFALAWDKANIKEAGVYSFVVNLKDNEGNFNPIAIYNMELK
ncbi:copper amine oxidase N-terminal domain-containing protein [Pseudobacteroides cellulosolvens]|nr:copper amine oxidase N-terminal domain-containing protein [Pseudobacteroides cellulosolvens]